MTLRHKTRTDYLYRNSFKLDLGLRRRCQLFEWLATTVMCVKLCYKIKIFKFKGK